MKNGRDKKRRFIARQVCPEFKLTPEQAATVGAELLRLGATVDSDGALRGAQAKKIVEAASKKSSPLYPYIFGQSDAKILATAREALARKLIQSVRVEIVLTSGKREVQPVMVHLRPHPGAKRTYVDTEVAQASQYMTDQKFVDATHRLNGWLDEFRAFRHGLLLGPLWEGVRALLAASGKLDDAEQRAQTIATRRTSSKRRKVPHRSKRAPSMNRTEARAD